VHEISISKTVRHHFWPGLRPPPYKLGVLIQTLFLVLELHNFKLPSFVDNNVVTYDENPANFIKQNTQQKGKNKRNQEREPKSKTEVQNPKWVTKGQRTNFYFF